MSIDAEGGLWKGIKTALLVILAVFILDVFLWSLILFPKTGRDNLELYFLDVGQGDSQLINLPGGVQVLIDAGPPNSRILTELEEIMPAGDSYVDLAVMTHPQLDHFGGLIQVAEKYSIGLFLSPGRRAESQSYGELAEVLKRREIPHLALAAGDRIVHEAGKFEVLAPSKEFLTSGDPNDASLVLMLSAGDLKTLYTGDIGFAVEESLRRSRPLAAHILKIPHHGSKFSSSREFIEAVGPAAAAIGVGKNRYGHPAPEVLELLAEKQILVLRTDERGTIKMIFREGGLDISSVR